MFILGIESSCDETAASVVEASREGVLTVRSDVVASQVETHRLWGGVVPELAGRAHVEAISAVTRRALAEADVPLSALSCVAVTNRPGLIAALLVGFNFAKSLAFSHGVPLVPVDHVHAHIAAASLLPDPPKPPYLAFAVSGGHTALFRVDSPTAYTELCATRDDAAGEAFDKVGRVIGLPYPAGAAMDRLASEGDPEAIRFPSPAVPGRGLDLSFSGLKTAALNAVNSARQRGAEIPPADLAASFTAAVVGGLTERAREAIAATGVRDIVLAGGVAANSHLRAAFETLCRENGARLYLPPLSLCGDNGAMAAAEGYFQFIAGVRADETLNAYAD